MRNPLRRIVMPSFLLVLAHSSLAYADGDDASARARLTISPVESGESTTFRLRSSLSGKPAFFLASGTNGPLLGGVILHVGFPFVMVGPGTIDARGLFEVTADIPDNLSGISFYAQGFVQGDDGLIGSEPAKLTIDAAMGATFSNGTGQLPGSTSSFFATDSDQGDIDLDGDFDIVLSSSSGVVILINDGTGNYTDESVTRTSFDRACDCVEMGDVDLDGDLDLFVGGGLSDPADPPMENALYLNDGNGFFTATPFPPGAGVTSDASFGDVDGDNDLDLLLANGQDSAHGGEVPDADALMINQGGAQGGSLGVFIADSGFASAPYNDPSTVTNDIAFADIDNDSDLDIFIGTIDVAGGGKENVLLRNDGGLSFVDITSTHLVPNVTDNAYESEFVDVDGDGFLDLVMAQSLFSAPGVILYLNSGSANPGQFVEDASFPQPVDNGEKIRLGMDVGDVDLDGDPDILFTVHMLLDSHGAPIGETLLYLNEGGVQEGSLGFYIRDEDFDPFGIYIGNDAVFVDVDHDGDRDVFIIHGGDFFGGLPEDRLLINDL